MRRLQKEMWVHLLKGLSGMWQPILTGAVLLIAAAPAHAASPWEDAVDVLRAAFTGPIARGLSLVAIVLGGLTYAYGEGDSKRHLAGIVFGVGMAIGAVNFMNWLFS